MLQINNRYNTKGELIDPDTYELQHFAALEEFLKEIYYSENEFKHKTETEEINEKRGDK